MRSAALFALLTVGCGARTLADCPTCSGDFLDSEDTSVTNDGATSFDGNPAPADGSDPSDRQDAAIRDGGTPIDAGPPPTSCPKALPRDNTPCATSDVCTYVGCNPKERDTATCISGRWNVVTHACTTAPDRCPATVPVDDSPCALPDGMFCVWDEKCIAGSRGACFDGKWATKHGGCGGPDLCPTTIPPKGTPCPKTAPGTGFTCTYRTECGVPAEVFCTESTWGGDGGYDVPSCTPAPGCPTSLPAARTSCSGRLTCVYPNGCGSVDYAQCYGGSGGWFVSKLACPDFGCPATPEEGATCSVAGRTCAYPIGDGCSISCTCSTSGGWNCVQLPCGAGAGGGK